MSLPLIYSYAPVFIQNALVSGKGYFIKRRRFNSLFFKALENLEQSNPEEICYKQFESFIYRASSTPFWQRRFSDYGVKVKSNDLISEVSKLPILTKAEAKENAHLILNRLSGEKINKVHTSGTTGSGLKFLELQSTENFRWAIWWRYRRRFGIQCDEWMAWFAGRTIVPLRQSGLPYWRYNVPMKQLMFSGHHLNRETVHLYYDQLKKSEIQWVHGYPSQLAYFANLIVDAGLPKFEMIRFVTTGAESLLASQSQVIETVFGVKPIQHYGLAESVANVSQLPSGRLQMDQDFGYLDLVQSSFDASVYKIVGTNYYNPVFPLIRYDTNDLAQVENVNGLLEIVSIDGRKEDFITLPNGVKLGRLDHIFKDAIFVKEAQVYQPDLTTIVLRIVKASSYAERVHEDFLMKECIERMGNDVQIQFQYLHEIPRTSSGKLRFVISEVKDI